MGSLLFFVFSWWGFLLQGIAIVHFIRRRPDTYWLFIILVGGWLGALVYIAVEVIPDAGLLRTSFQVFPRRKRIRELELAILDNPSAGNYEELGLLYLDDGNFSRARACYDKAISGQPEKSEILFQQATKISTMSETYYNYALLLQSRGRVSEARQWTQKILDKRRTMPGYLHRRERPWFRKAYALLARLSVQSK